MLSKNVKNKSGSSDPIFLQENNLLKNQGNI